MFKVGDKIRIKPEYLEDDKRHMKEVIITVTEVHDKTITLFKQKRSVPETVVGEFTDKYGRLHRVRYKTVMMEKVYGL